MNLTVRRLRDILAESFTVQKNTANAKRKRSWPNVYSRKHRSGQVGYIVDIGLINGKRQWHSFKTKAGADTFAELNNFRGRARAV
jgi:hypothetical protein